MNGIKPAPPANQNNATPTVISTQNAAKLAAEAQLEAQSGVRDGDESPGVGTKINASA
jgi:hypothetical protein